MKKALVLLSLILMLASPVLAASYSATITVTESGSNDYTQLPVSFPVDNTYLADNNFIAATGLDTRVLSSGTELPHMVVSDRTLFVADISADTQHLFDYTAGDDPLSSLSTIVGYDGYITVSDHADLDMEDSFTVDIKGYINTDAGANKNLMYREDSFIIYIQAEDSIRAAILSAGDVEDLAITATGITSGVRKVVVVVDGEDFTISVYNASDVLIDDATASLGANSVPDSGNDYVFMQSNCMAYAEYIKLSTSE